MWSPLTPHNRQFGGTSLHPEKGGSLGSPLNFCRSGWGHSFFCSVVLKQSGYCIKVSVFSSPGPLARESRFFIGTFSYLCLLLFFELPASLASSLGHVKQATTQNMSSLNSFSFLRLQSPSVVYLPFSTFQNLLFCYIQCPSLLAVPKAERTEMCIFSILSRNWKSPRHSILTLKLPPFPQDSETNCVGRHDRCLYKTVLQISR